MRNFILSICLFLTVGLVSAQNISNFPYFTGFEGVQGTLNYNYPAGWTYEDLNGGMSNQSWQIIKNSTVSQNARTDSTAIHMFSSMSETNNDWLFTPGIEMKQGGVYTLTFWYNTKRFGSSVEKCKVHIGSSATETGMEVTPLWDENNLTNETYQMATVTYTATADEVKYFGFNYYSDALSFILYVDDITITELVTGIENANVDMVTVAPNPCVNELYIKNLKLGSYQCELFDMNGRRVSTSKFNGASTRIDVQNLVEGNYLLLVTNHDNESVIQQQISVSRK